MTKTRRLRPRVTLGEFTFISGDSFLVVSQGNQVVDMLSWKRPRKQNRPLTEEALEIAAREWLVTEHPEIAVPPKGDFWGV